MFECRFPCIPLSSATIALQAEEVALGTKVALGTTATTATCASCNKAFTPKSPVQKYCRDKCRTRANTRAQRARRRTAAAAAPPTPAGNGAVLPPLPSVDAETLRREALLPPRLSWER